MNNGLDVAKRFIAKIKENDDTLVEVKRKTGIHQSAIYRYRDGKDSPSGPTVKKMLKYIAGGSVRQSSYSKSAKTSGDIASAISALRKCSMEDLEKAGILMEAFALMQKMKPSTSASIDDSTSTVNKFLNN